MLYRTIKSLIGEQSFGIYPSANAKSGYYWRSTDGQYGGPISEGAIKEYLATPADKRNEVAKNWQIQENQYLTEDFDKPGLQKTAVAFMIVRKPAEMEAVATFTEFD